MAAALWMPGLVPETARAQAERALPAALASDSVAWERIAVYVVSRLSTHLVRTASDTSPQPWRITLPPAEPQGRLLEMRLETILRARPIRSDDSVAYELDISPLAIANDTARVTVRTDFKKRCAGSVWSGGYVNVDRVFVVRHPRGFWSIARTEGVRHGDRFGC
jgi:hypothetical protein